MKGVSHSQPLLLNELVLMLYGSFARLKDLFAMQANRSHLPSAEEYDDALIVNHALSAIVAGMLASGDSRAAELRLQMRHSSVGPIADIARKASGLRADT